MLYGYGTWCRSESSHWPLRLLEVRTVNSTLTLRQWPVYRPLDEVCLLLLVVKLKSTECSHLTIVYRPLLPWKQVADPWARGVYTEHQEQCTDLREQCTDLTTLESSLLPFRKQFTGPWEQSTYWSLTPVDCFMTPVWGPCFVYSTVYWPLSSVNCLLSLSVVIWHLTAAHQPTKTVWQVLRAHSTVLWEHLTDHSLGSLPVAGSSILTHESSPLLLYLVPNWEQFTRHWPGSSLLPADPCG